MKKLLSILLCAALVLGLAACGAPASEPSAAPATDVPDPTDAAPATDAPSGELEKLVVGASSTPQRYSRPSRASSRPLATNSRSPSSTTTSCPTSPSPTAR